MTMRRARNAAALPVRLYRIVRASVHLVEGLSTLVLVYPWVRKRRRHALIARWSARLLRIFGISPRVSGRLHQDERALVLVANHVSWLDIFVINALQPARFIAKAELKRWPMIGWLIAGVGTLFIERDSRRHVHDANRRVREALARADVIAVFPEGGVSDGSTVRPFHGSLLQPVVELQGVVQPVAIRYRSIDGAPTTAVAYLDEVTFMGSVWRIAGEPALHVDVSFAPALSAASRHRRDIARDAEDAIRRALGLPAAGSAPDTAVDRPA